MLGRHTSLLLFISLFGSLLSIAQSQPQDVWTWHYDNYRTGWQQNETTLMVSNVTQNTFGKIMQFNVAGAVYAQPLALQNVSGMTGCPAPPATCNVVFVVTQQDMLYAFNADYNGSRTPGWLWSLDLARQAGGAYLNCAQMYPPPPSPPCEVGVIGPDIGVTSTPVIDRSTNTLYVVSLVYFPDNTVQYYLHAVNYLTGKEFVATYNPLKIQDNYPGPLPTTFQLCGTFQPNGDLTFQAASHFQRAALLLLNHEVYVAFAAGGSELVNGWLMAFSMGASGPPAR